MIDRRRKLESDVATNLLYFSCFLLLFATFIYLFIFCLFYFLSTLQKKSFIVGRPFSWIFSPQTQKFFGLALLSIADGLGMETDGPVAGRLGDQAKSAMSGEEYTLLFGNNNWYILLRLHQVTWMKSNEETARSGHVGDMWVAGWIIYYDI